MVFRDRRRAWREKAAAVRGLPPHDVQVFAVEGEGEAAGLQFGRGLDSHADRCVPQNGDNQAF